jgi:cyanophycin synthetase
MSTADLPSTLSTRLLSRALIDKGYTQREIELGLKYVELTSPEGWKWLTRTAYPYYPFISRAAEDISRVKDMSYAFAKHHGIAVPETMIVTAQSPEAVAFLTLHGRVVVKPLNSGGSRGVSMDVTDQQMLQQAIEAATVFGPKVLIQKQYDGTEYRFTIIEGELAGVHCKQKPVIIGDGVSTVAELIAKENQARKQLVFEYMSYPQLDASLVSEEILHDTSVLAAGESVQLNDSSLISRGASVYDVTDAVHQSYKQTAIRLACELGSPLLVVDMLIIDPNKPQNDANYVFLESGTKPALKLYYSVRDGKHLDIIPRLAEMIDAYGKRILRSEV